ncbi:Argonaute complex, subunit Arb1 [Sphaerosporella brunnea]|uniref:Argonaute complex, subunit Arb1 n=1 Tax=Sphaerosporella brunnea TaxID=1250544 RepID=A0A5J5EV59_9PEZI|nr:Argonaute complex, subunit Arb1 [Sphaerosporella brunnea]
MATSVAPISPPAPTVTDDREQDVKAVTGSKDSEPSASTEASESVYAGTTTEVKLATDEKKKKRKKKGGSGGGKAKGHTKPSGFEEYVVDGPPTKEEAEAELALYDVSKPFSQRMETCIQRYKARRKWDPTRLLFFTTYLALGGVSTGQKQFFGGMDEKKMDDMDAEHIATMAATDFITLKDRGTTEDSEWEVDFAYVVRGFLSYKVPYVLSIRKLNQLELACKLIKNFLNYVVFHSVAPEYHANIMEAVELCNTAEKELVLCANVSNRLPGTFNMACSTIYDGLYAGIGDTDKTWEVGVDQEAGLDEKLAKELILVALSKRGTPEQQAKGLTRKVVRRDYMSLEVVEVILSPPDPGLSGESGKTLPESKFFRGTQALGSIKVKPWIPEDPLAEYYELPQEQCQILEIWLEKAILQYCFVGMHLEARVHRFDDGLNFIDSVTSVLCSFFLRLENPINDDKDSDDEYD